MMVLSSNLIGNEIDLHGDMVAIIITTARPAFAVRELSALAASFRPRRQSTGALAPMTFTGTIATPFHRHQGRPVQHTGDIKSLGKPSVAPHLAHHSAICVNRQSRLRK
jgi:hypothetical protein